MLAQTAYKLDNSGAMMNFEDWIVQVWLPDIEPCNGRRISELLAELTVTQFKEYYKKPLLSKLNCKARGFCKIRRGDRKAGPFL